MYSTSFLKMKERIKKRCVLAALCVVVLVPYHRLILGKEIPIPSDVFISDLADGEFPLRVEAGRLIRAGELPFWTPNIMTGTPLLVDPLSMLLFTLFPPALALGLLYGVFLSTAATGTYTLARHLGASRSGAFLSGFSFAWSGFFVCQMRHLGILGTVALFPYALYCLDRALLNASAPGNPKARTLLWLMLFALCFGLQIQAAFPQTVYICGLFYGLLILWRLLSFLRRPPFKERLAALSTLTLGIGASVLLGTLMGMIALLPLWELGTLSDRAGGIPFEAATALPYPLACIITFFCPYYYGDFSNLTFTFIKEALFWEVYGYAGMFTCVLAILATILGLFCLFKRKRTADSPVSTGVLLFLIATCILSFCMVLGPLTPLYRLAFDTLPGFSSFRFPTRFLFVTVLALTLLGGLGLTTLQAFVARLVPSDAATRNRAFIGGLFVLLTIVDLLYHNRRQNPMTEQHAWLSDPETATVIKERQGGRTYSPDASVHHKNTLFRSKGWSGDLSLFSLHRNLLQPNSNLLYGVPSLNAYSGISPHWVVDIIGDHNRYGLLLELRSERLLTSFYQWLEALSVPWYLSPSPLASPSPHLPPGTQTSAVSYLYALTNALPRTRFASQIQRFPSIEAIKQASVAGRLDPTRTTLVHTEQDERLIQETLLAWAATGQASSPLQTATITTDRATQVVIDATSPQGGLLVLADTYYPGWRATVDGAPTPILRVNQMHRGVLVPPGAHTVTFRYQPWTVRWGILLSLIGFLSIVSLTCYYSRKAKEAST